MKKKKKIIIIGIIIIVVLIIVIFFTYGLNHIKSCECESTTIDTSKIGLVKRVKETKEGTVPKVDFMVKGEKLYTLDNEVLKSMTLNEYEITSLIDSKLDNSTWLGFKLTDLLELYKEDFKSGFTASSGLSTIVKKYDSIDSIYIFFKRNNEFIKLNDNNAYVLADINKDAKYWLYNFELITKK